MDSIHASHDLVQLKHSVGKILRNRNSSVSNWIQKKVMVSQKKVARSLRNYLRIRKNLLTPRKALAEYSLQ